MSAPEIREGGCLCGSVRFEARLPGLKFGACHCEMCRRWTGSALLGMTVPLGDVVWKGEDQIATYQSSEWAMRAWCRNCGSNLYFKVTDGGPWSGGLELPIGLFDNPDGLEMTSEIYIDHKPGSYAFAGEGRTLMTRAECVAKFAKLDSQ